MPTTVQRLEYKIGMGYAGFARGIQAVAGGLRQIGEGARTAQQRLNDATDRMEQGLSKVRGAAVKAGAALAAISVGAYKAVKVASEAQETLSLLEQTFGDLTDETLRWADQTGRAMGRSRQQMRQFAGSLQAMLVPMVGSREQAAEMSRTLAELAVDLGSFFNVADDDALLALRSALAGETEPMRRFGVVLTEAQLRAFALEQGIKGNVSAMSEAEKVTLRYRYILSRTTLAQGDAVRTADSFSNQYKAMQGEITNLTEELGERFIPAATKVVQWARDAVRWFRDLDDETKDQVVRWALLATGILGVVAVLGLLSNGVSLALQALTLLAGGIAFLLSPLGLGLTLLIAGGTALWTAWNEDWGGLRTRITGWAKDVGDALRGLGDWISGSRPAEVMRQFVADLKEIWADEELTFGEKVVESLKLIPGVGWVTDFVADLRQIWADEDLTFKEKVVASLKLLPGAGWITDFAADLKEVWGREDLSLGEKLIETFKLLPGVGWITGFIEDIRKAWDEHEAEIKLAAPALAFAGLTAALLLGALFRIPGIGFVLRGATALLTIPARVAAFTISLAFGALQWLGALGIRAIMAALNVITLGARWTLLGGRWALRFLGPIGLWITIGALAWEYGLDWAHSLEEFRRDFAGRINEAIRSWFAERGLGWLGETLFGDPLGGAEEQLQGFQTGGIIPGHRRGDRVPILAEEGEAIVPRDVVRRGLGAIIAWFLGQGVRHGIRGFQTGGLVGVDPTLAAGIEEQRGILSGLEGALMSMARTFMAGLMHALDLLVTVLTAIGRGLLGEERWAQFQAAIDVAREKVAEFVDALTGSGGADDSVDDLGDAAEEAAEATRTWKDRLRDAGLWVLDFTKQTLTGLGNMILASAPIAEGAVQAGVQGMASGGPMGAVAGVFLSLLGSSRQFGKLMERINPLLQAAADVVGAFLTPLIPLVQLLAEQLQPVLQQLAPAFQVLGEIMAAILLPVVQAFAWVMESIVLPIFQFVANAIAAVWNAIANAINWALGWLGVRVPTIKVQEADTSIDTGAGDTGDGDTGGSGGPAFAELAGPARDLLVELLRPLARLDTWTGYLERIATFLSEIRDVLAAGFSIDPLAEAARTMQDAAQSLSRLVTDGLTIQPSPEFAMAGGAGGDLQLTIVYPDDLENQARLDALAEKLSGWLGRSVSLRARAQRGRS